jgi:hypothetical protein
LRPLNFAAASRDRVFAVLLASAIVLAWIGLLAWESSPYGRYLDHDGVADPQNPYVVALLIGGWVTMIVAMMLPTSWPLLGLFDRMTSSRPGHLGLLG